MIEKVTQLAGNVLDKVMTKVYAQNIDIPVPDKGTDESGAFGTLGELVTFVVNIVFGVGLALALVFVIYGGIKYVTSAGDQTKAEEARNAITNAIIGAVVIIAFRVLINLALNILGVGTKVGDFF